MAFTIGLDVGTTSLKGLLIDATGAVRATASQDYPLDEPHPGWSQQDPHAWWRAAQAVSKQLVSHIGAGETLGAVGLSGQMHGSTFMDAGGKVLYPAILWNDQRTHAEAEAITEMTGGQVNEWTLNPPRTAFTASKILWFMRNEPQLAAKVRHVLLPKDYLRWCLTDDYAGDVTDASGTNLLDVRRRDWSDAMLQALDIPREWLYRLVEANEVSGTVTTAAAEATGIPAGTPVVGGGGDQPTASIGNGVGQTGVCSITIGTSGVVYVQLDGIEVDPTGSFHTFCHAIPGTWMMMAGVLSAGGSLRWYHDVVGAHDAALAAEVGRDSYEYITEKAASLPPGAEGLIWLPYLTGERSPHNDPLARGAWVGLTTRHNRAHMARAVLEGVCFALRDLVEQLGALNVAISEVRVAGGGARSDFWMQLLADILNRETLRTPTPDASAYGAAILAMSHALQADVGELCMRYVQPTARFAPNGRLHARYNEFYAVYRDLYPANRDAMHRLSRLSATQ